MKCAGLILAAGESSRMGSEKKLLMPFDGKSMVNHVLKAIGLKNEMAHSSIRFSLGRFNTESEIQSAIKEINKTVTLIKEKSTHYQMMNA